MIVAQRIIRRKGSKFGVRTGKLYTFRDVKEVIAKARRSRHVFSTLDVEGNESTVRSGRKMRRVDTVVRNVTLSGIKL